IRHRLALEVQAVRRRADEEAAELEKKAEEKLKKHRLALLEQLRPMMEDYTRSGKLDEALALRDQVRKLRAPAFNVRPDPGNLLSFENIGESHVFEVVGTDSGPLWGTDVYTADSDLSTAAVHAGVLAADEKGVVRVTIVDMTGMTIEGSHKNGVWSHPWGPYPVGYRVARA